MQRRALSEGSGEVPSDEATLFARYGSIIFAYIRKHVSSREDAEDLTLEVFMAAIEKKILPALPPEEQLAWLKRVTYYKLVDVYRKTRQVRQVSIDLIAELFDDEEEPEHMVLQRESDRQLHQLIQQLPAFQQQLLYLRYAHNLNSVEIGVLLNKNEGTIRQQLARTRKRLRESYHRQEQKGGR